MASLTHAANEHTPAPGVPVSAPPPLGKGGARTDLPPAKVEFIALDKIQESALNPRKEFARESIEELAASIAERGLQQNLVVRPLAKKPGYFELMGGARRLRALHLNKAQGAMCKIMEATDAELIAIQIVENLQRQDLAPLEEAEGFKRLQEQAPKKWTAAAIGRAVGKTDRFVSQRLAIAGNLSAPLKTKFAKGEISVEVARTLAALPGSMQTQLKDDYSVRANNANELRRAIAQTAIPVSHATFDLKLYTSDILEEGAKKYFLNIDEFRRLQTVEARKVVEALKAEWPKAQLIDVDEAKAWNWADELYAGYSGLEHTERKYNKAAKYNVDKEKCTAVVWVARDGRIRQAQGVCPRAMIDAAATKRARSQSRTGGSQAGLKPEAKDRKAARLEFNKKLQAAIAKDDSVLTRLHLLHLLSDDYPCPMEAASTAHFPTNLQSRDLYDDEGVTETWAAIVKLPIATVRSLIRTAIASSVKWPDYEWEKPPGYMAGVAATVGLKVPALVDEPAKPKAKAAAKPKTTPKKPAAKKKAVRK